MFPERRRDLRCEVAEVIYDVLELILVSHNGTFTTLDIISPGLDRFRPPRRSDPRPDFGSATEVGVWGRLNPPAEIRRPCPLLDTPTSTIKK